MGRARFIVTPEEEERKKEKKNGGGKQKPSSAVAIGSRKRNQAMKGGTFLWGQANFGQTCSYYDDSPSPPLLHPPHSFLGGGLGYFNARITQVRPLQVSANKPTWRRDLSFSLVPSTTLVPPIRLDTQGPAVMRAREARPDLPGAWQACASGHRTHPPTTRRSWVWYGWVRDKYSTVAA